MVAQDPYDVYLGPDMVAEEWHKLHSLNNYITPLVTDEVLSIRRPFMQANNFGIKSMMIQIIQSIIQFSGYIQNDLNTHICNFLELGDTFKINWVLNDTIKLRLFPLSLCDKAKGWLHSLPMGSITTWDALAEKFLANDFPSSKTIKMHNDIISFVQMEV